MICGCNITLVVIGFDFQAEVMWQKIVQEKYRILQGMFCF